jgi:uncharacterized membrane protein
VDPTLGEWLNLLLRWVHVFTGILWIGQTWLFTFFENHLQRVEPPRGNVSGELWLVHSGGYYQVEKQKAEVLPQNLHWFKWEAAITWLSGLSLLLLVYYAGGLLVDDRVADISVATAAGGGILSLVLGWFVYEGLCRSPLRRNDLAFGIVGYAAIVAAGSLLLLFLSGRAAYLHVGAMLGTIMTANVWGKIIPGQRRMVASLQRGESPDLELGEEAKARSRHNTYIVVPVVFLMLSSHFPTISYGHAHAAAMLAVFVLMGLAAAHFARSR